MSAAPAPSAAAARRTERKVRWAVALGGPFVRLLGHTWRVAERRHPAFEALLAAGRPYLLSSWHGSLLPHIWANRERGLCAMVSQHGDGEIIARIMETLGFNTVRGSSTRGGREALVAMIRRLQAGDSFAITPDGPRGPSGVPHPGALAASVRSGVPIVPIRSTLSSAWTMGSWDGFQVPKPFARVEVEYGEPWLPTASDEAHVAELTRRMGQPPTPRPRTRKAP